MNRLRFEEAQALVIDRHIYTVEASAIASLDHQMMGTSSSVEDLFNIDIGKPLMDAPHRFVIGILVDRKDKLCGLSVIQVVAVSNYAGLVGAVFVIEESIAPKTGVL